MKHLNKLWILLIVFVWSCGKNNDEPTPEQNEKLVSVTYLGEYKRADILTKGVDMLGSSAAALGLFLQYDVKYYKVVYETTTTDGKTITASGAMVLPNADLSLPLVSIQHGTLFTETDAPSYFKDGTESLFAIAMASAGFYTVMPDYVGYGESKTFPHPYEHAEGLAVPNVDFLLAVKEHFRNEKTKWNNKLLLAGYSEGGYATLATQKLLEEKYNSEFTINVSSCGAGAYHKSLLLDKFMKEPTSGEVNHNKSYIYVIQTYNRIHGLNRPMSDFFKEPYASLIEKDGFHVNITGSFNSLLNPTFVQNYLSGKETKVTEAFRANDLVRWKTNISTYLTHGTADTYVPFVNSSSANEELKNAGSRNVVLDPVSGGTHSTTIQPFLLKTFNLFLNNKN